MSALEEFSKLNTRAPLDRSPNKNWVENSGGLPMYIRRIANHIHAKGKPIGHSIAIAVNAVKKMCSTGDVNFPGRQQVNAGSQAEACAAVQSWERKKASARVSKGIVGRKWSDEEFIAFLVNETEIHKSMGCDCDKGKHPRRKKKVVKKRKKQDPAYEKETAEINARKSKYKGKEHKFKAAEWTHPNGHPRCSLCGDEEPIGGVCKSSKLPARISKREFDRLASEIDTDSSRSDFDFEVTGQIEKRNDEKQLVFGWCSVAKHKDGTVEVDKQGDVLEDIDQMEKVAYDFVLHSRDGGEMHVRKGVSTLVESFVSTPEKWEAMEIPEGTLPVGWWVGFKVNDREVWKGVKDGKYKMFSVHGSGVRKELADA